MIIRHKSTSSFSVINNHILRDDAVSLRAKGLYAYIMSLPDDWAVYMSEVEKHSSDGKDSHRAAIKELIDSGYVTRERERKEDGTLGGTTYNVYETPVNQPKSGKPYIGEAEATNNLPIPSTDIPNVIDKSITTVGSEAPTKVGKPAPQKVGPANGRCSTDVLLESFFTQANELGSPMRRLNRLQIRKQIVEIIKAGIPVDDIGNAIDHLFSKHNAEQGQYMVKLYRADQLTPDKVNQLMMKVDEIALKRQPTRAGIIEGAGKRI